MDAAYILDEYMGGRRQISGHVQHGEIISEVWIRRVSRYGAVLSGKGVLPLDARVMIMTARYRAEAIVRRRTRGLMSVDFVRAVERQD